jgi:hypothetical protein
MTGPRMANGVPPSVVEVIGDTPTAELSEASVSRSVRANLHGEVDEARWR